MTEVYDHCVHLGELSLLQKRAMKKEILSDMKKDDIDEETAKMNFQNIPFRIMRREGFKEIYCNNKYGCPYSKDCVVKKMIIKEKDLTTTAIIGLVGKEAFESSVERSTIVMSNRAGYRVARKNAEERAVFYWRLAMLEGKQEAKEEIAVYRGIKYDAR